MNDIDFDALDQAVANQMDNKNQISKFGNLEKVKNNAVKNQNEQKDQIKVKKESPKPTGRGKVIDFVPKRSIGKKSIKPPVRQVKKVSPTVRKNQAVQKTIEDIFRSPAQKQSAVKYNQTTLKTKTPIVNKIAVDNSTSNLIENSNLRQKRRLYQPVEINQKISAEGGKVVGHYQSKTFSRDETDGSTVTYKKDSLDYVADFSDNDKKPVASRSTQSMVIKKTPVKKLIDDNTDSKLKQESVKQTIESKKDKPSSPFLETTNLKKRPLGIPEKEYKESKTDDSNSSDDFETFKARSEKKKSETSLYQANKKIAEPKKKSGKKSDIWGWVMIIISIIGFAVFIHWIQNNNF